MKLIINENDKIQKFDLVTGIEFVSSPSNTHIVISGYQGSIFTVTKVIGNKIELTVRDK